MIQRVNIPQIDCGDNGGCLSEMVSILVFIVFFSVSLCVISLVIVAIVGIINAIAG